MLALDGLQRRAQLLQTLRTFFVRRGYLEVDTPIRLPVVLPEAHIVPLASEGWFLQTSPEQCMKRLLAVGAKNLFQICPCFRAGEIGRYHQPEFTLLEWYHSGWSYAELMQECEQLLVSVCRSMEGMQGIAAGGIVRDGRHVDLAPPWIRLSVSEAFERHAAISVRQALEEDRFDEILVSDVEPHLGWQRPVFLVDYPIECAALARKKKDDPALAERFELYLCGIELANGFSELVDVEEQRARFVKELASIGSSSALPEKFLEALATMGETAGIALGVDRLLMILAGADRVSAVTTFTMDEL